MEHIALILVLFIFVSVSVAFVLVQLGRVEAPKLIEAAAVVFLLGTVAVVAIAATVPVDGGPRILRGGNYRS